MLDNYKLNNLGFVGPSMTWTNKCADIANIHECVDHATTIVGWQHEYHETFVTHLLVISLDPVLFSSTWEVKLTINLSSLVFKFFGVML